MAFDTIERLQAFGMPLDPPRRPRLPPLRWPAEFDDIEPPEELIEGLLIADSLSEIFGPPKSGKTFLALDMALHVARGLLWNGRRAKAGLVIYAAGESAAGVMLRVRAWHQHHGLDMRDTPFAVLPIAPDLRSDGRHVEELIALIRSTEEERGTKAVLVVIDTVSRALAGGDDSSAADMGSLVMHADRLRLEAQVHVALIHHSGKDTGRGSRGSNVLPAAVGTQIEVRSEYGGVRVASVVLQRDLPDGEEFHFRLEPLGLGLSPSGKALRSLVIVPVNATPTPDRPDKLTDSERVAMRTLDQALKTEGVMASVFDDHTEGLVVNIKHWRACFYREGMPGSEQATKKKAFQWAVSALLAKGRIATRDEFVWPTQAQR